MVPSRIMFRDRSYDTEIADWQLKPSFTAAVSIPGTSSRTDRICAVLRVGTPALIVALAVELTGIEDSFGVEGVFDTLEQRALRFVEHERKVADTFMSDPVLSGNRTAEA